MLVKVFWKRSVWSGITIEVNIDKGIGYHLVGLPDNAIKESSIELQLLSKNNGYSMPGKR
jgi:magnesium chelatase family protein